MRDDFVDDIWKDLSADLCKELDAGIPVLDCPTVCYSMKLGSRQIAKRMLRYLDKKEEDFDSLTEINHKYHWDMYWGETEVSQPLSTILEWGAGYGQMAKIVKSEFPDMEYHIVDLPGPLRAQQEFLEGIEIIYHDIEDVDTIPNVDMFISTWALSESTRLAHQYTANTRRWFNANRLLLAFQSNKDRDGFRDAEHFKNLVYNLNPIPIPAYNDGMNFYVFK